MRVCVTQLPVYTLQFQSEKILLTLKKKIISKQFLIYAVLINFKIVMKYLSAAIFLLESSQPVFFLDHAKKNCKWQHVNLVLIVSWSFQLNFGGFKAVGSWCTFIFCLVQIRVEISLQVPIPEAGHKSSSIVHCIICTTV